jgi:hypothetical protein
MIRRLLHEKVYSSPANGLEMSRPAAQATPRPLYGSLAGSTSSNFPHASLVNRRPSTPWHRPPHRPGVLPGGQVCGTGQVCPSGGQVCGAAQVSGGTCGQVSWWVSRAAAGCWAAQAPREAAGGQVMPEAQ